MERSNVAVATANALIVERQAFFIPYFRKVLAHAGHRVSEARKLTPIVLRLARPDTIVVGESGLGRKPLSAIRLARRECPAARIIVVAYTDDPAWAALACALGADVVLGPHSSSADLAAAVDAPFQTREENASLRRTSYPQ